MSTLDAMSLTTYPTDLLPLEVAARTPGDGFTKLPMPDGEGLHTGGPFLSPDGLEVWKPLDGISNITSLIGRIPTSEAIVLEQTADQPGFPRNWRVELKNDRLWLVRPRCKVLGQDLPIDSLTPSQVLHIEQAVRSLNAQYWEINDRITVAIDPSTNRPFLLDLSAAQRMGNTPDSAYRADDWTWVMKWLESIGATELIHLRQQARNLLVSLEWLESGYDETHSCVYRLGTDEQPDVIESAFELRQNQSLADQVGGVAWLYEKHWWVITPNPIYPDRADLLGLEWGWSPIVYT